jgi:hypothetical protein
VTSTSLPIGDPIGPRGIVRRLGPAPARPRYSLCTMVTRWEEYEGCLASFRARGFDAGCCEVLAIDNSRENVADAYQALNEFLQAAGGDHLILCHQDILLLEHGRAELDGWIERLDRLDPHWALCGNAGHTADGRPAICISHPHGPDGVEIEGGPFPTRVVSLDENFMVARRVANLALSRDLAGYHHYGADLCLVADVLGWNSYVIGFFLRHNSGGTLDGRYFASRRAIMAKYRRAFRPRWVSVVTRHPFYVSGTRPRALARLLLRRVRGRLGLLSRGDALGD